MSGILSITAPNNQNIDINVIDVFTVDEYANKQYIAYTLFESEKEGLIRVYISILNEQEQTYTLEVIEDKEEEETVIEAFKNMTLEEE